MTQLCAEVSVALTKATDTMKRFYDRHQDDAMVYHEGDLVWLEATNISMQCPSKKLDHYRLGPFVMQGKVGSSSYRLQLPDTSTHHTVFNQDLL